MLEEPVALAAAAWRAGPNRSAAPGISGPLDRLYAVITSSFSKWPWFCTQRVRASSGFRVPTLRLIILVAERAALRQL